VLVRAAFRRNLLRSADRSAPRKFKESRQLCGEIAAMAGMNASGETQLTP
jgi:hypothetical protein